MKQVLSVLVENEAGVLNKITGLFARRGYNIESLAVGPTDDSTISRITLIVDNGTNALEQVEKQLNKLIGVIKVKKLEEGELSGKELMLIKVSASTKERGEIKTLCDIMGARIDDISPTTITIALAESPDKTALFQSMMKQYGILEIARTGLIAVQKGAKKLE